MWVIATAGHVDHGKSTLVRALTGMEPDRWAEERRRGMTIDLGYAWTALDPEQPHEHIAFVDVPGHQKFVTNMLAGVGPVPAVMLVIAADAGWSRQTSEHLDAIDALGIEHGLVAVTRADLASPEQVARVRQDAIDRAARTSLGAVEAISVSGATGTGLGELRLALRRLIERLPTPRTEGRVRLFIDRSFSVTGAGTVVTGTLGAGRIGVGDQLELHDHRYTVRGLQQLGEPVPHAGAVARVAVNLRGVDRSDISRGDCLLTPDAWHFSDELDVEFSPLLAEPVGEQVLHLGSASVPVRVRPLDETTARLQLARALPVQLGDRGVLRDPAQQSVTAGVVVLDADPPTLRHRGAAAARAAELASGQASTLAAQVRRRGAVTRTRLQSLGVSVSEAANVVEVGEWLVDPGTWASWITALHRVVDQHALDEPQQPWLTEEAARRAIGLPGPALLRRLVADAGLETGAGRLGRAEVRPTLGRAEQALAQVVARLAADPFDAPERDELAELGLTVRDLAAADKAGLVLRLAPDLAVAPDAVDRAQALLRGLAQPFTASQARQALRTTRRIALPLLEHLDRIGVTVRVDGALRTVAD